VFQYDWGIHIIDKHTVQSEFLIGSGMLSDIEGYLRVFARL